MVYAADIRLSSSCLLADAIIAANNDRPEGGCPAGRGADTIILTRDITLDGGLPKITSDITIEGGGYAISGDNRYRMFYNDGGALTIHDLTMTKGRAEGDIIRNDDDTLKATTANPIGGAIVNWKGTVTISDSGFSNNSAEWGGAIDNWGELSITNSIIAGRGRYACSSSNSLKRNIGNFIQNGSCSPAFKGDPMLGELVAPEDGSLAYFPLLAGSRAIDAADDDYCPAANQIGATRPQGAGCDIGAVEYAAS